MILHFDGYDKEVGAYRVLRSYAPDPQQPHRVQGKYLFAWFIEEAEAKRFIEVWRHFGDVGATESEVER